MDESDKLMELLGKKIDDGRRMVQRMKPLIHVDGVDKFVRKINQEIRFLEKVQCTGQVKKDHLQSTNLIHLDAIVDRVLGAKNPVSVMKPFKFEQSRLEVDVVCDDGTTWVKVVARNARALTLISLGNGEYGQKSVLDQAEAFLRCARMHPRMYRAPEVAFHFAYGIESPLAARLERLGVAVEGEIIHAELPNITDLDGSVDQEEAKSASTGSDSSSSDDEESIERPKIDELNSTNVPRLENFSEINVLNLDVSTLLAYVTNMTNGRACYAYREPLLTMQAEWERARPVKPILEELFVGKQLIVCRTAYENFTNIIGVIGGPDETRRAEELKKRVRVVPDDPCERIMKTLPLGGRIKDRSRLVFATGETTKSITVSANEGFVRAARMQGIECAVFLHEPRSLSEVKEAYAEPLNTS